MEIVACMLVNGYTDVLVSCLDSLRGFADRIIAVDGIFNPHYKVDFESRLKAQDFVNKFNSNTVFVMGTVNQVYKEVDLRNTYLHPMWYVNDEDTWILQIDTDEIVSQSTKNLDVKSFLTNPPGRYMKVVLNEQETLREEVKLFKYQFGMKYVGNHKTIQYPDGIIFNKSANCPDSPITLHHNKNLKPVACREAMKHYLATTRFKVEKDDCSSFTIKRR